MLEHDAVRQPVGHIAADTRDSEPVDGAARRVSDPSCGGGASVVLVSGDVVPGEVVPGEVVPVLPRIVVVVTPTELVGAAVVGAAVVGVPGADVVVVPFDVLRAMNVKASASVSV